MAEARKGRCETCRFWERRGDLDGLCHRFPPVFVTRTNDEGVEFPNTLDDDWCGEWQPLLVPEPALIDQSLKDE